MARQLVQMQFQLRQAALRNIHQREAALLRLLAELNRHKLTPDIRQRDVSMIAYQNEVQLHKWVDQRRATINIELAQVKALKQIEREGMLLHFGRQQALADLADRLRKEKRVKKEKRDAYWS